MAILNEKQVKILYALYSTPNHTLSAKQIRKKVPITKKKTSIWNLMVKTIHLGLVYQTIDSEYKLTQSAIDLLAQESIRANEHFTVKGQVFDRFEDIPSGFVPILEYSDIKKIVYREVRGGKLRAVAYTPPHEKNIRLFVRRSDAEKLRHKRQQEIAKSQENTGAPHENPDPHEYKDPMHPMQNDLHDLNVRMEINTRQILSISKMVGRLLIALGEEDIVPKDLANHLKSTTNQNEGTQ